MEEKVLADLEKELRQEKMRLEKRIAEIDMFMKKAPEGILVTENQNGKCRYYHEYREGEERAKRIYINTADSDLARTLSVKAYYKKLRSVLVRELHSVNDLLYILSTGEREKIYRDLAGGKRCLVNPMYPPEEYLRENWKKMSFDTKGIPEGTVSYTTFRGEQVRSKSELIIANELDRAGVPYRYELPLFLKGFSKPLFPDFTCLKLRTGQLLYWEHLGMTDDSTYVDDISWKMNLYSMNGILPGERLILSFENRKNPISVELVRRYIQEYLL